MRLTEDVVDTFVGRQQLVKSFGFPFVCQLQLVLEVVETVVDGCGREHQHLGLHARAYDLVHQSQVAVVAWILTILVGRHLAAIAEVVALVNHHKVIVAPVDTFQVEVVALPVVATEVGMIKHIIIQTILGQRVVGVVLPIGVPVLV